MRERKGCPIGGHERCIKHMCVRVSIWRDNAAELWLAMHRRNRMQFVAAFGPLRSHSSFFLCVWHGMRAAVEPRVDTLADAARQQSC